MASSARIDGSLPDPGDASTRGLVFSGGWGVDYEFAGSPLARTNQPHRLSNLGFPAPFDCDLEGALRGRANFTAFLYLFKNGHFLRLDAATLEPDGPDAELATAPAWGLPSSWTSFDAVVPGRGSKINFCYFIRGAEYVRFDWLANAVSTGYPKSLGTEWHFAPPFATNPDGMIAGQGDLGTRGFLFKRLPQNVDADGNLTGPGSIVVETPGFARYDFTAAQSQGTVLAPTEVSARWGGLMALLDTGPAVDLALKWCDAALDALSASPSPPILATALSHHFMTSTPTAAQLQAIQNRLTAVRARVDNIPIAFQWTRNLPVASSTTSGVLTEIGDVFSNIHGPNGRAAVLIHEAVHFTSAGELEVDVPEWSGQTINGQLFRIADPFPGVLSNIAYDALTTDQAIENPGSYASFAQEIFFGQDNRFGGARRHE